MTTEKERAWERETKTNRKFGKVEIVDRGKISDIDRWNLPLARALHHASGTVGRQY
jgi:hypothetical protein